MPGVGCAARFVDLESITVIRLSGIIAIIIGVLFIGMPGGSCFVWAAMGVEHHHHSSSAQPIEALCFHQHHHHCPESDEESGGSEDSLPCDSQGDSADPLVLTVASKIAPAAPPASSVIELTWLDISPVLVARAYSAKRGPPRGGVAQSPPAEVRFCRFLI